MRLIRKVSTTFRLKIKEISSKEIDATEFSPSRFSCVKILNGEQLTSETLKPAKRFTNDYRAKNDLRVAILAKIENEKVTLIVCSQMQKNGSL